MEKEEDEFLKRILDLYLPNDKENETGDFFTLQSLKELHQEEVNCYSLKNKKVYDDWNNFLNNLPESKDEIVPRPLEKYWRWKMYKKYIPEERTNFRKSMKNGPGSDNYGIVPMSFEDTRIYRQPSTTVKNYLCKKKN